MVAFGHCFYGWCCCCCVCILYCDNEQFFVSWEIQATFQEDSQQQQSGSTHSAGQFLILVTLTELCGGCILLQAAKLDIPVDANTTADAIAEKLLAKVPDMEKQ